MKKLNVKKSVKKDTKVEVEKLQAELKELQDKISEYQEKEKELCGELMLALYHPYKDGDVVNVRFDDKLMKGIIGFKPEIHRYFPLFYPQKKDGGISQKYRFISEKEQIVGGE